MTRILITGKNSYVGTSLSKYLKRNYTNDYLVDEISMRDEGWKKYDFSSYDVVFHVAGIAHVSTDPKLENEYYKVNRDLTIAVANKAKKERVKQFIFMSSMIIFGKPHNGIVDLNTQPNPENFYGKSKLEAENGIKLLESDTFKISILRPPMIYGPGSKGNYPKLAKLARITPVFPNISNQRSMLFIDNLSMFVKMVIDYGSSGTFYPQNNEYVTTSQLVKEIALVHKRKIWLTTIFNPIIWLTKNNNTINKVFSDLIYIKAEDFPNQVSFTKSIFITEKGIEE